MSRPSALEGVSDAVRALNPGVFAKTEKEKKPNKYKAIRTWSEMAQRVFDSKAEARRAEELMMLEKAGKITGLTFQVPFLLCSEPKIEVTIDFAYKQDGEQILEDYKGVLTRDSRTKYAWMRAKYGYEVRINEG